MNKYEISDHLKKILKKLRKKDKSLYETLMKKMEDIINCDDVEHYKNLRYNMKDSKRVHVGSFVLVFQWENNKINFDDFDHHDNIY